MQTNWSHISKTLILIKSFMKECTPDSTIIRVATLRGNSSEAVSMISHIVMDGCKQCREKLRLIITDNLIYLFSDPKYGECKEFVDRMTDHAHELLSITGQYKQLADDKKHQQ
jgi:hypothetical protein